MEELVQWLRARLAEDEEIAKAATPGPWVPDEPLLADWVKSGILGYVADCSTGAGYRAQSIPDAAHIAAHDPARVLREIDAKRQIAEQHRPVGYGNVCLSYCHTRTPSEPQTWPCLTLRLLALPYADRPGYQEGWRP